MNAPYYQAVPQQQEQISLGPYNAQQAPFIECESCGTPITVGQELVKMERYRLAIMLPSGQLCFWASAETEFLPTGEPKVIFVHADCSAEYAHDNITKEPCGEEADVERVCMYCSEKLDGDGE